MKKYAVDPKAISLDRFFELTGAKRLLPGRVILQESIEERLQVMKNAGINNLYDLFSTLKSKEKIAAFSQQRGIPETYLVILRREAGSYIPKPIKMSGFPGIPIEYVLSLKSKGINDSEKLYEAVQSEQERVALSKQTGIPTDRLMELLSLCDLVRINGVGAIFARIIYETGIESVEQFTKIDVHKMYPEYIRINGLRAYSLARFSESDLEFCIVYAKELLNH